jgi:hypothetical protein
LHEVTGCCDTPNRRSWGSSRTRSLLLLDHRFDLGTSLRLSPSDHHFLSYRSHSLRDHVLAFFILLGSS